MPWLKYKIGYVFHGEYSFIQLPGPDSQSDWDPRISNSEKQDYIWTNTAYIPEHIQIWFWFTNKNKETKSLDSPV